jgi:LDH2 family malate/lactate/ureidoglycolate dehydrogenase
VINPEFFVGLAAFTKDVDEAAREIKKSPAANPESPVLLPGEVENAQRAKNKNSIEISTSIWQSIQELAEKVVKP